MAGQLVYKNIFLEEGVLTFYGPPHRLRVTDTVLIVDSYSGEERRAIVIRAKDNTAELTPYTTKGFKGMSNTVNVLALV